MRVLHLLKTSEGAKWALLQMSELVKLGVEVHVALPPGGRWYGEYEKRGATVHPCQLDFPIGRPWRIPGVLRKMREVVRAVNPDLIHSHFVGTTLTMRLALGWKHPVPRIFQIPGPLHLEHWLTRKGELATASRNDFWIGTCRWVHDALLRFGIPKDKVFLSYYGVDISEFAPRPLGKLRNELSLGAGVRLIGTVAYMYAPKWYLGATRGVKGHEDLIDAFAICLGQMPEMKCVFIGGAWSGAERYAERVTAYGRRLCGESAVFLGNRNDVLDLYPDLELVVCPSISENVGGVVEPLLFGKPVVATNVGGIPDLVIPGETGWLVEPRNPKALAAAILEALRNPQRAAEMAAKGRERARRMFDARTIAREMVGIYEKVLSRVCC